MTNFVADEIVIPSDEELGRFARQQHDWFERVRKGSLDPKAVMRAIQQLVDTSNTIWFEWTAFYQEVFGIEVDFAEVQIPEHKHGFDRVIIMANGLTLSQLIEACKGLFTVWCNWDDPDSAITKNERVPVDGAYAIRVRGRVEADEEFKSLSAEGIAERGISTMSALERVLLELKYFHETGKHLDLENITLCAGSRDSYGDVPLVFWRGELFLSWDPSRNSNSYLRAREVVSL